MAKFKLNIPLLRTIIPISDKWRYAGFTREFENKILSEGECSIGIAKVLAETFGCEIKDLAAPKKKYSREEQYRVLSEMEDLLTENISATFDVQYIIAATNQQNVLKYLMNKI